VAMAGHGCQNPADHCLSCWRSQPSKGLAVVGQDSQDVSSMRHFSHGSI